MALNVGITDMIEKHNNSRSTLLIQKCSLSKIIRKDDRDFF